MGVMKMGNIAPRVVFEPSYLEFWVSVLTNSSPRLPGERSVQTATLFAQEL